MIMQKISKVQYFGRLQSLVSKNIMLRSALVLFCIALAVQAKPRKGPLTDLFGDEVKPFDVADEPENKIIGGTEIDISERPFQVAFLYDGSFRCSGAWMGGKNILTSGVCCDGVSTSSASVRMGSSKHDSGGDIYNVAKLILHPNFDYFELSNDACILILEETPTNSIASPVSLPSSAMPIPEGAMFVVSGWGTTSESGPLSDTLRQVEIPYVNDNYCSMAYGQIFFGDVMICAGEVGGAFCTGDSGGPITYQGTHVGIVSWGYGCARPYFPGVFAQTDAFLDFISSNTH